MTRHASPPARNLPSLPSTPPRPAKSGLRSPSLSTAFSSSLSATGSLPSTRATSTSGVSLVRPTFPSKIHLSTRRRLAPSSYSPFLNIPGAQRSTLHPSPLPSASIARVETFDEEDELDRMIAAQSVDRRSTRRSRPTVHVRTSTATLVAEDASVSKRNSSTSDVSGFSEYVDASEGEAESFGARPEVQSREGGERKPPPLPLPSLSPSRPQKLSLAAPYPSYIKPRTALPGSRTRNLSSRLFPIIFRKKSMPVLRGIGSQDSCSSLSSCSFKSGSSSFDRGRGWATDEIENTGAETRKPGTWGGEGEGERALSPEVEVLGERFERFEKEEKERIRGIAMRRVGVSCS